MYNPVNSLEYPFLDIMKNDPSNKEALLREVEHKGEFTLKELVSRVNRLIPVFVPEQKRYKVSELVNERIIRYYLNKELIDKPDAYKGRFALFSSRHVLQVLVVKYLQSSYVPLKKIFEIVQILHYQDLKNMLLNEATGDFHFSGLIRKGRIDAKALMDQRNPVPLTLGGRSQSWKSFRIHDQLELKVERGFDILGQDADMRRILSKILMALSSVGQENHDDGGALHDTIGFDSPDLGYMSPAIPLENREKAVIALITEGGLVPRGNPDRLESARARRFFRYNIQGINELRTGDFESIDRGWDNAHVNDDPHRLLPLDIMRELEEEKEYSKLHPYYYTTTGAGTSIDSAKSMGKKIAKELKAKGVSAVLMTST